MAIGIKKFLRMGDSDTAVTESWRPTFNDMMRMDESDTDSDIPALSEMGANSPWGNRGDSEDGDFNLGELRELVETHLILADQDTCVTASDDPQEWKHEKTMGERLDGLVSERDTIAGGFNRYRTGGG